MCKFLELDHNILEYIFSIYKYNLSYDHTYKYIQTELNVVDFYYFNDIDINRYYDTKIQFKIILNRFILICKKITYSIFNYLDIHYIKNFDLINIQNFNGLTKLYLTNCNSLKSVNILHHFTSLKLLNLYDCDVNDISFLTSTVNLIALNLAGNYINDYKYLENLQYIQNLNLSETNFCDSDILYISNLTNIHRLYLNDNQQITNVSYMSNLNSLEYLDLNLHNIYDYLNNIYTKYIDLKPLSKLKNLKRIYVYGRNINNKQLRKFKKNIVRNYNYKL